MESLSNNDKQTLESLKKYLEDTQTWLDMNRDTLTLSELENRSKEFDDKFNSFMQKIYQQEGTGTDVPEGSDGSNGHKGPKVEEVD